MGIVNKFFHPHPTPHKLTINGVKVSVVQDASSPLFKGAVTLRLPPEYRKLDYLWVMTVSDNVLLSFFPKLPEGKDCEEWSRYQIQQDQHDRD